MHQDNNQKRVKIMGSIRKDKDEHLQSYIEIINDEVILVKGTYYKIKK